MARFELERIYREYSPQEWFDFQETRKAQLKHALEMKDMVQDLKGVANVEVIRFINGKSFAYNKETSLGLDKAIKELYLNLSEAPTYYNGKTYITFDLDTQRDASILIEKHKQPDPSY